MPLKNKPLSLAVANALLLVGTQLQAADITVNSSAETIADDGACTLPEAIENANADSQNGRTAVGECAAGNGFDQIRFELANQTVTLTSALPNVNDYTSVDGNGAIIQRAGGPCTPDGTTDPGEFRLFTVTGSLSLSDVTLQNGCADGAFAAGNGGAVALYSSTNGFSNVRLADNRARGDGGGLYVSGEITRAFIIDSTFSGNSARYGGGMDVRSPLSLNVTRSTFSDNTAAIRGGGIRAVSTIETMEISNSTFSGNSANLTGGGLYSGASLNITDSTFVDNLAGNSYGAQLSMAESTGTATRNLFVGDSDDNCDISPSLSVAPTNLSTDVTCGEATTTQRTDLLLGPLSDNGGPTLTHAPGLGSVAIDTGGTGCEGTDQRGVSRLVDGNSDAVAECDVGSVELQLAEIPLFSDGFETQ